MNNYLIDNLYSLKNEIREIAVKCGRDYESINIVAVSKNFSSEHIRTLYECGQKSFGENRAQEMIDKYNELKELDIDWHFIGRIQTNKIKYIVQLADYIHSVWRLKEIDEIQKRAESLNKIQKIFLEVNVSGEETKAGLKPSEVDDLIANIVKTDTYQNIEIIGLMTMAPYTDDETVIRRSFSDLRKIRNKLQSSYKTIKELSMGMSNDYKIAIEEGATYLRIGTRIFGERPYK